MKNLFIITSVNTFFFLIIINYNNINSYLIFPLEYLNNDNYKFFQKDLKQNIPEILLKQIYYRNLITRITIGSNKKNQIFFIETNKNKYYISSLSLPTKGQKIEEKQINYYNIPENELYNEASSSSYNEIICKKGLQNIDHYLEICSGRDKISFNINGKIINLDFPVKIAKNHDENITGVIGLLLNDTSFNISRSLITELKAENIIDNYYWFIDIDEISPLEKKIKANLIIGGLPHEIYPKKYSIQNYKTQNIFTLPYIFEAWRIKFDKIYTEENVFQNTIITFTYEIYHIIGTLELQTLIQKKFMNKLIEDKKCFFNKFPQNIYTFYNMTFYYCDLSVKNVLYDNINTFKFFSFDFSFIFELTKEELFYIKDNYIYFNIIFGEKPFNYWIMGQIFTTKYNFVFNTDTKKIGFYQKVNKKSKQQNSNCVRNKESRLVIVIMVIIAFIFMCIGLIVGRKIFGLRRKIIVNELIDEQNYEYKTYGNKVKSNDMESNYKPIGNRKNGFFEMTQKFES